MLAPAAGTFGGGFRALSQQRRRRNLHLLDGRKAQKSSVCGELRGVRHSRMNVPDFSDGVTANMGLIAQWHAPCAALPASQRSVTMGYEFRDRIAHQLAAAWHAYSACGTT